VEKIIVSQKVGGDGAVAVLAIDPDGGTINVELKYPVAKLVEPVNAVIDSAIDKIEGVIPGDWDKALLEPIRAAAHAEIAALISGGALGV